MLLMLVLENFFKKQYLFLEYFLFHSKVEQELEFVYTPSDCTSTA